MEIMYNYSDLITEIEIVKEQIKLTKRELEFWFGIDLNKDKGTPLSGIGSDKFGANTSLIQGDKKIQTLSNLQGRLKELEYARVRMEMLFERLDGLDYKIAYLRIVKKMKHKEIADELGYSEQYIRIRWANLKQVER